MNQDVFAKNISSAQQSMGDRFSKLNWELISERRNNCAAVPVNEQWKICADNFLVMPQIMPSSDSTSEAYAELNHGLALGGDIHQYLDVHAKDPHLFTPLLELREAVEATGFDRNYNITQAQHLRPYFLVAFGTGDGVILSDLIRRFKPHHVVIALSDWQDFATSFWHLDWIQLSIDQAECGGKITIARYDSHRELLAFLSNECFVGMDHAIFYSPPITAVSKKSRSLRSEITREELDRSVKYLGYTIDEINMVWNSWRTLSEKPRVFKAPQSPINENLVVCGSGPSLDKNIELLRELSRTHFIIACGSNFRTLKANNVRVDFLALMERSDDTFDDMNQVVELYGAGETKLIASSTCHDQLFSMLSDSMSFFRPALTPLSVFSNGPDEILSFEGPESINTGIAIATALKVKELILVGVDLGAQDLDNMRSKDAIGCSVRTLDLEERGNFCDKVYTSVSLMDAKNVVEICISTNETTKVLNASEGVYIKGATPIKLREVLDNHLDTASLGEFHQTSVGQWWNTSSRYTLERFKASWKSRRPRAATGLLMNELRQLLSSDAEFSTVVIKKLCDLMSLDVPPGIQFPRRIIRSSLLKLALGVYRQLLVMKSEPNKMKEFEQHARSILIKLLDPLEEEIYSLCDTLEAGNSI